MPVDIDRLRALIEVLTEKDIAEFEHEDESTRIRIVRGRVVAHAPVAHAPLGVGAAALPAAAAFDAGPGPVSVGPSDTVDVTSPFVGTFYRSPAPDAPSFVDVGSVVRAGQTLCIVEAMKLMNEIEAEHSGTITEIFAQSGKAVEFGQKLFRIKKA
jgi:acetyl-CoA carboxylase biotin carboxyl carrier protein